MALVVEEKPFVCLLSVDTLLEVVISFNDFYANEWQATVGSCLYCQLHGGNLRLSSVLLAAFGSKFLSRFVIMESIMPKHNFWGTIVPKSNYYKAPHANFSALRPVHSVQTGFHFLSLTWALACLRWLKMILGREVCKISTLIQPRMLYICP